MAGELDKRRPRQAVAFVRAIEIDASHRPLTVHEELEIRHPFSPRCLPGSVVGKLLWCVEKLMPQALHLPLSHT